MKQVLIAAFLSTIKFTELAFFERIHLTRQHIGVAYTLPGHGKYKVFRETIGEARIHETAVTFMVGFRLRWIGTNPFLHWIFQRICIITTPFWSGFRGFHCKLWMVNPTNLKYVGIYDWYREKDAHAYIDILLPILRFFSTRNSVWYICYPEKNLATLLSSLKNNNI